MLFVSHGGSDFLTFIFLLGICLSAKSIIFLVKLDAYILISAFFIHFQSVSCRS